MLKHKVWRRLFSRPMFLPLRARRLWRLFLRAIFLSASLALSLLIADVCLPLQLPADNQFFARTLVDESGRPLRAFADQKGIWRYPITLEQVSPRYVEALLAYEDRWFWHHPGINPVALARALVLNIQHDRIVSGGSTLSMQVARLLHPHSRTVMGKLQQILRTLQLEWHLSKTEILTLYLNIAPFGGTIEGVQAASYTYLNKSADNLTDAEAALLAVLPQSPTRLRPDLHPQAAELARNKVLDRLSEFALWSSARVADAKLETVYAARAQQEQIAPLLARRLLHQGDGQRAIETTLDGELQRGLEDYLANTINNFPAQTSAAILVVDNRNGAVKAYLGSANFADSTRFGHVDMITAIRSPGSTLKPFLFAKAIDAGMIHSESLLADVPRSWGNYRPSNFNSGFIGPVSASSALQRSLNMPFVELLDRYGPKRFSTELENAGLQLHTPGGEPNLALILGGTGASLEQLVQSYTALANNGLVRPLVFLKQQLNEPKQARYLLSPQSAWITQKVLADIARPGSLNTLAHTQQQQTLAWKTGTSYGFRDSWAIGVSANYSIGVWVGRPDGTALPGHSGRESAAPILFSVADYLRIGRAHTPQPSGITQQEICWPLGSASTALAKYSSEETQSFCHQRRKAWVANNVIPPTWHKADSDSWQTNPLVYWQPKSGNSEKHTNCQQRAQHTHAEKVSVALWPKVLEPWIKYEYTRAAQIPSAVSLCNGWYNPASRLKIIGIAEGNSYRAANNSHTKPSISLSSVGGSGQRHWYFNGIRKYSLDAGQTVTHALEQKGAIQILVVDDGGDVDQVTINLL
ncbi:penicillin-binding protein 1C [Simiduia curdlanivorans]|uniref:peptidoglycan glycosyltransferase n=1 Tax=Simiduia curdlanivorans TaxID=1492769 RepID=A0ABV8V652_9GAMM|nr:penicillin-binding protein 1C [Simiduia curdlanivorans]MDN3637456.1 penicillin-binding protein 1C [Simiduia curdlanivorans]